MLEHGGTSFSDTFRESLDSVFVMAVVLFAFWKGVWDLILEPSGRWFASLGIPGFSRVFQRKYKREQIREVLRELLDEVGIGREARSRLGFRPSRNHVGVDSDLTALRRVVILASKYTNRVPNTRYGAGDEVVPTDYYIDTMGAVHCAEDRVQMAELLRHLLKSPVDWSHQNFKFILTPKDGNPILASAFADGRFHVVLAKDHREASRLDPAGGGGGLNEAAIITNFEGASRLIDEAKMAHSPLEGVLLDCNCSTGRTLKTAGHDFNAKIVGMEDGKISPITRAFVLFRPDQSVGEQPLADAGIHLYRYMDFTNVDKTELYKMRPAVLASEAPYVDPGVLKAADKLIAVMKKKNQIRFRA